MGKKRKHAARPEVVQDKPDYAADWFRPEPKKEKPKPKDESVVNIEERISGDTMARLAALKAKMEATAEPSLNAKSGAQKKPVSKEKDRKERVDDDENLSFAELFDPQEDEADDFEELLKDSKLDWRSFKE